MLFRIGSAEAMSARLRTCIFLNLVAGSYFALRILFERLYSDVPLNPGDLAKLTALCVYTLILPVMIVTLKPQDEHRLLQTIFVSVIIVLGYALAQKALGDYAVVVPGVTANWDDAQVPDFLAAKHNMIFADTMKLTSTYQNGNLLALNLLLLLPLTFMLAKTKIVKAAVAATGAFALLFAASRAAWGGSLALVGIALMIPAKGWTRRLAVGVPLFAVAFALAFSSTTVQKRALDSPGDWGSWAGRIEPALALERIMVDDGNLLTFIIGPYGHMRNRIALDGSPEYADFGGAAYEMFYVALIEIGGLLGLFLWAAPVALSLKTFYQYRQDPVVLAVFLGIAAWAAAAVAEGAFWNPPTAFNYWVVIAVGWLRIRTLTLPRNPKAGLPAGRAGSLLQTAQVPA
jgi:hypothetical protein